MQLNELFVSHKQVDPVSFLKQDPELEKPIYFNLERAQQAASRQESSGSSADMSSWKVGGNDDDRYAWVVGYKKDTPKVQPPILPQEEKEETKKEDIIPENTLRAYSGSEKLQALHKTPQYHKFKSELDKFMKYHPEYKSITDALDYVAALESSYNMSSRNGAGSGALGWFQFMDNTRHAYNKQSREEFSKDPQAQLLAAAQHYTSLQNQIKSKGGDPDDFVTMYGAWWRPASAIAYIKDPSHDIHTRWGESFGMVRRRAADLVGQRV